MMKKITSTAAVMFFASTLHAATDTEIYHGFANGNPDLQTGGTPSMTHTAVQPGIGSSTGQMRSKRVSDHQIYRGFERGNPDLYSGSTHSGYSVAAVPGIGSGSKSQRSVFTDNDIYHGFEKGNPDL